jgi:hypothetical protein
MARAHPDSILLMPPGLPELRGFVNGLNTKGLRFLVPSPKGKQWVDVDLALVNAELHRLVHAWFKSGPNTRKLFATNPSLVLKARSFRTELIPTNTGCVQLIYGDTAENMGPREPVDIAQSAFLRFLLNPYNKMLAGPCANCGGFFMKTTRRKKAVYCSAECGRRVTSRLANELRRRRDYEKQLSKAQHWVERWQSTTASKPWKDWVASYARISKHWLTRAVRTGQLAEPVR